MSVIKSSLKSLSKVSINTEFNITEQINKKTHIVSLFDKKKDSNNSTIQIIRNSIQYNKNPYNTNLNIYKKKENTIIPIKNPNIVNKIQQITDYNIQFVIQKLIKKAEQKAEQKIHIIVRHPKSWRYTGCN